jgi:4'-phosphopantetheinyl transferase
MWTNWRRRSGRRLRRAPTFLFVGRPADRLTTVTLHIETLDVGAAAIGRAIRLLDDQEQIRAAAFRFTRDASRFVARRARLREILSGYAGAAPERLAFAQGANGKPILRDGPLHFSLSHSRGLMMLAVAEVEVGCDIEWIDPDLDWPPIAERLFAPAECEALDRLPGGQARRGFFDCWARKEAYVKALGQGLSHPLDAFEVSVDRDARMQAEAGWAIADVVPGSGYAGAVVARADVLTIAIE